MHPVRSCGGSRLSCTFSKPKCFVTIVYGFFVLFFVFCFLASFTVGSGTMTKYSDFCFSCSGFSQYVDTDPVLCLTEG